MRFCGRLTAIFLCLMELNACLELRLFAKDTRKQNEIELQALEAKFDPRSARYTLSIEENVNLDVLTPQSDWNKAYSIGRAAFIDGDFRRAFNAFKLALIKARAQGIKDARLPMTQSALDAVKDRATTVDARLGMTRDQRNDKRYRGRIDKVFPGTLAWLAGIKKDDRIITLTETGNLIKLKVERNGKMFSASIVDRSKPAPPPQTLSTPQTAKLDFPSSSDFRIKGQITDLALLASNQRLLANHDLVVIVDKSSSMGGKSLPGGLSAWDWCRNESSTLSSMSGYFPQGIKIVMFDDNHQVFRNCGPSKIASIFQTYGPSGGTDLAEPLWYELSDFFSSAKRRPRIIAILSDFGTSAEHVRGGVLEAANRVRNQQELTICLLQVGRGGDRLVQALDDNMVDVGAPYDIVDATSFEELQRIGLKNALIAALLKKQYTSAKSR